MILAAKETEVRTSATTFSLASDKRNTVHVKQRSEINQGQRADSVKILLAQSINKSHSKIIFSRHYILHIPAVFTIMNYQ